MTCNAEYIALCSVPRVVSREGHAGEHASIDLPFHGRVYFSGEVWALPGATYTQNARPVLNGVSMPDTFHKGLVG